MVILNGKCTWVLAFENGGGAAEWVQGVEVCTAGRQGLLERLSAVTL